MKRKALFSILAVQFLFFSLCGCAKTAELGDRLIIEALGIDTDETGYTVTVQALDTGAGGSGEGRSSAETTKIYNFFGSSAAEALSSAAARTGLEPFYSHARFLILGKDAAEKDAAEILDFFLRRRSVRADILIAAAEGKAADVVCADVADGISDASAIERELLIGNENGENTVMRFFRFADMLFSEDETAYCPVISVRNSAYGEKKEVRIVGTAFFDNEKMIFTADKELSAAVLLLTGAAGKMTFRAQGNNGKYLLNTVKCDTKIKPSFADGGMFFEIDTRLVCDISEFSGKASNIISQSDTADAESAARKLISEKENRALETLFRKNGCDICRFCRRTLLYRPGFYDEYKSSPGALTDYSVNVSVKIRRTGREIIEND